MMARYPRLSLLCAWLFSLTAYVDLRVQCFVPAIITKSTLPLSITRPGQSFALAMKPANVGSLTAPVVVDIKSPDDLKNFVTEDDRPAVIKVYAEWCKTCKQLDIRYRKVALIWGGTVGTASKQTEFSNTVRFAQMEYGGKRMRFDCDKNGEGTNEKVTSAL